MLSATRLNLREGSVERRRTTPGSGAQASATSTLHARSASAAPPSARNAASPIVASVEQVSESERRRSVTSNWMGTSD